MKVWKMIFLFQKAIFSGSILVFGGSTGSSCSRFFPARLTASTSSLARLGGWDVPKQLPLCSLSNTHCSSFFAKFCLQPSSAGDQNKRVLVFFWGVGWRVWREKRIYACWIPHNFLACGTAVSPWKCRFWLMQVPVAEKSPRRIVKPWTMDQDTWWIWL